MDRMYIWLYFHCFTQHSETKYTRSVEKGKPWAQRNVCSSAMPARQGTAELRNWSENEDENATFRLKGARGRWKR